MSYDFRLIPELIWVAVGAAILTIGTEIAGGAVDGFLADPGTFALALALSAGRAAVAAVVARLSGSFALR